MNKFQLFLETEDPEMFKKATSELGTIFYRVVEGDGVKTQFIYDIAYFSGSRIAKFYGTPTEDLIRLCKVSGFEVSILYFDETAGTLKVKQKR